MALTTINRPDDQKALFGTGNDLDIYHDGSHAWVNNSTGNLYLRGSEVVVAGNTTGETIAHFVENGAAILRYDNSVKFETQANGVTVTGDVYSDGLICGDNDKIELGDSGDLWFEHNGSWATIDNNTGDLNISTTGSGDDIFINSADDISLRVAGTEDGIKVIGDGAVELFYDNSKKFETTSTGGIISGDLTLNDNTPTISLVDTNDSDSTGIIQHTSGNLKLKADSNAAMGSSSIRFEVDGSEKWRIDSNGWLVNNSDSGGLKLGAGNDLAIYHNGTDAFIDAEESGDTRSLFIKASDGAGYDAGTVEILGNDSNKLLRATNGAGVELFFDNTVKLIVETDQIQTRDDIIPNVDSTDNIGADAKRYANGYFDTVHTSDINMSNEGTTNDVDGTWGNYTIQEGEDDLFLINRRNGKKYKFNLTEVS